MKCSGGIASPIASGAAYSRAVQPGMRVNTAIHRANRLTPIEQTLPFTCVLLGDQLGDVVDRYSRRIDRESAGAGGMRALRVVPARRDPPWRDRGSLSQDVIAFERVSPSSAFAPAPPSDHRPACRRSSASCPSHTILCRCSSALGELRRRPTTCRRASIVVDCRGGEPRFGVLDDAGVAAFRARGWLSDARIADSPDDDVVRDARAVAPGVSVSTHGINPDGTVTTGIDAGLGRAPARCRERVAVFITHRSAAGHDPHERRPVGVPVGLPARRRSWKSGTGLASRPNVTARSTATATATNPASARGIRRARWRR
jgi:hypothetical protein